MGSAIIAAVRPPVKSPFIDFVVKLPVILLIFLKSIYILLFCKIVKNIDVR
jgi:hypothetical protein